MARASDNPAGLRTQNDKQQQRERTAPLQNSVKPVNFEQNIDMHSLGFPNQSKHYHGGKVSHSYSVGMSDYPADPNIHPHSIYTQIISLTQPARMLKIVPVGTDQVREERLKREEGCSRVECLSKRGGYNCLDTLIFKNNTMH